MAELSAPQRANLMAGAALHDDKGYRESNPADMTPAQKKTAAIWAEILNKHASPEASLLDASNRNEFDQRLDAISAHQPHYRFSPLSLSIGGPLEPLMQKMLDLAIQDTEESPKVILDILAVQHGADPTHLSHESNISAEFNLSPFGAMIAQAQAEAAADGVAEPAVKGKKAKKEKAEVAPLVEEGIILYTDAGAKPNPGYAGYGIHGYSYSTQLAKKGSGNTAVYLTDDGYKLKSEMKSKPHEITPMKYFDGFGTLLPCTNNAGEVIAVKEGLLLACKYDIKKLNIYTDSDYAVKGTTQYMQRWEQNGWIKSDGSILPNSQHWKALSEAYKALQARGCQIDVSWVRGHGTNVGNIIVDRYATMGVKAATAGATHAETLTSPTDGYWASQDHHPFIHHNGTFFTTNKKHNTVGEYCLSDISKDTDTIGKRAADTSYAYVTLTQAEPLIEMVRTKMLEMADAEDLLAFVSLSNLFENTYALDLEKFRTFAMHRPHPRRIDIVTSESTPSDQTPILTEINPPRIAIRAIEAVNALKGLLNDWQTNPKTLLVPTDITAACYDTDEKGATTLKSDFGPGFTTLKVNVAYAVEEGNQAQTEVGLVLGVDTPERNALKKLEKKKPTITVLTWREATAIRYATVVKVDDGIGIWAGYHANTKYLK